MVGADDDTPTSTLDCTCGTTILSVCCVAMTAAVVDIVDVAAVVVAVVVVTIVVVVVLAAGSANLTRLNVIFNWSKVSPRWQETYRLTTNFKDVCVSYNSLFEAISTALHIHKRKPARLIIIMVVQVS